jgi:hypothetical protein
MTSQPHESDDYEEYEVRELLLRAVIYAREHGRSNVCDEAVVQHVMADEFIDGTWRSTLSRPVLDGRMR